MIITAAVVLGATLGTASGILILCWLSYLCKSHRKRTPGQDADLDPEKPLRSVLYSAHQFIVKKSTESIQPQALLKFPKIYRPKPSVTSSEVVNFPDYTPKTINKPFTETPATVESDFGNLATDGSEEVFILPKQDSDDDPICSTKANPEISSSVLHPKLHFTISQDSNKKHLHVTVIEAENVEAEPGSEGYVLVGLRTAMEQRDAQTKARRLTHLVRWEQCLVIPLPRDNDVEGEVALSLLACSPFSRHTVLGHVRLMLADVAMASDTDRWVDLQPPAQDTRSTVGELLVSVSYLPAANRLGVVVMKAKELQSDQLKDVIDLSVKLTLKHQATKLKKKQTRRVKHKANPVWNEMMMLEVPQDLLSKCSVELEVTNQMSPGILLSLGCCQLGLRASGTGGQHWHQMLENPRKQTAMWHLLHAPGSQPG